MISKLPKKKAKNVCWCDITNFNAMVFEINSCLYCHITKHRLIQTERKVVNDSVTRVLSQVRICRPPPLPLQMRTVLNQIINQLSDIYFLSYGCLYLQFTKNVQTKNKVVQKCSNLQES